MDIAILNERFCNFSTYIRGYSPATVRRYRTVIRLFQRRAEITHIGECTESKVREFFYRGRMERGWSASAYATYHKSLVVFFRWCAAEKCLPSNPAEGVEVPKAPRPLPRKLSLEEASRVLEFVANAPWQSEFERRRNLAVLATFLHAGSGSRSCSVFTSRPLTWNTRRFWLGEEKERRIAWFRRDPRCPRSCGDT